MDKNTPAFDETPPAGAPAAGRIHHPPTSLDQAKARVAYQMNHLEDNCRIGLDVGYAVRCLDEALGDYLESLGL